MLRPNVTSENKSKSALVSVLVFALGITVVPLWYGFTIAKLWSIYLVPIGAPVIGTIHGYGIHLLVGRLIVPVTTNQKQESEREKHGDLLFLLAYDILRPAMHLAFGWLLAKFWGLA